MSIETTSQRDSQELTADQARDLMDETDIRSVDDPLYSELVEAVLEQHEGASIADRQEILRVTYDTVLQGGQKTKNEQQPEADVEERVEAAAV